MTTKMHKEDLHKAVAKASGLDRKTVEAVLTALVVEVKAALAAGSQVSVEGLATLKVKDVAAKPERSGFNPITKAPMTVAAKPAHKKVVAKAGSNLL
jgi:nucleoid DNA-binding protein